MGAEGPGVDHGPVDVARGVETWGRNGVKDDIETALKIRSLESSFGILVKSVAARVIGRALVGLGLGRAVLGVGPEKGLGERVGLGIGASGGLLILLVLLIWVVLLETCVILGELGQLGDLRRTVGVDEHLVVDVVEVVGTGAEPIGSRKLDSSQQARNFLALFNFGCGIACILVNSG